MTGGNIGARCINRKTKTNVDLRLVRFGFAIETELYVMHSVLCLIVVTGQVETEVIKELYV